MNTMKAAALDASSTGCAALVKELVDPPVGKTEGSITVRFDFTCVKGEDEVYEAVNELCPWTVLALMCDKVNGVTADKIVAMIPEVMAMDEKGRKILRESLKTKTTATLKEMGSLVTKTRSGKTKITVDGVYEVI